VVVDVERGDDDPDPGGRELVAQGLEAVEAPGDEREVVSPRAWPVGSLR